MAHVYILKSIAYPKTYVGSTTDLAQRIKEHNSGTETFTKRFCPWQLVHQEYFADVQQARLREKYLKSAAGRRWIKKNNLI